MRGVASGLCGEALIVNIPSMVFWGVTHVRASIVACGALDER